MEISPEEKRILLEAVRNSIESIFTDAKPPETDYKKYPVFKSKAGAFVTLTQHGNLRGCIGYILSDEPLFKTVCNAALQAAQYDPRFPPLSKHELEGIEIEISLLSEPFPMNNYDEIEIGKHGLILEELGKRALLLPQVPVEHKMNRDQYLSALCQKGGLYSDYWKEKTLNIKMFTATVFSESGEEK